MRGLLGAQALMLLHSHVVLTTVAWLIAYGTVIAAMSVSPSSGYALTGRASTATPQSIGSSRSRPGRTVHSSMVPAGQHRDWRPWASCYFILDCSTPPWLEVQDPFDRLHVDGIRLDRNAVGSRVQIEPRPLGQAARSRRALRGSLQARIPQQLRQRVSPVHPLVHFAIETELADLGRVAERFIAEPSCRVAQRSHRRTEPREEPHH